MTGQRDINHPVRTSVPSDAPTTAREDNRSNDISHGGDLLLAREDFQLRLANSHGRQNESGELVRRMYAWRGYKSERDSVQLATEATLQTCRGNEVFGTLTIRYDSERGLAADALYRAEID